MRVQDLNKTATAGNNKDNPQQYLQFPPKSKQETHSRITTPIKSYQLRNPKSQQNQSAFKSFDQSQSIQQSQQSMTSFSQLKQQNPNQNNDTTIKPQQQISQPKQSEQIKTKLSDHQNMFSLLKRQINKDSLVTSDSTRAPLIGLNNSSSQQDSSMVQNMKQSSNYTMKLRNQKSGENLKSAKYIDKLKNLSFNQIMSLTSGILVKDKENTTIKHASNYQSKAHNNYMSRSPNVMLEDRTFQQSTLKRPAKRGSFQSCKFDRRLVKENFSSDPQSPRQSSSGKQQLKTKNYMKRSRNDLNHLMASSTGEGLDQSINNQKVFRSIDMSLMQKLNNRLKKDKTPSPLSNEDEALKDKVISTFKKQRSMEKMKDYQSPRQKLEQSRSQENIYSRLIQRQNEWVQMRKNYQAPDYEAYELQEKCTFKPNLYKSPLSQGSHKSRKDDLMKRTFQEFIKEQEHLEFKKEQKIKKMQQEFINDYKNQSSFKIVKHYRSSEKLEKQEQFFERLKMFETKKEEKIQKMQNDFISNLSFQPKINKKRSASGSAQKSHNSIERTAQKSERRARVFSASFQSNDEIKKISKSARKSEQQDQELILVNQKSLQYVCQKLHKELDQLLFQHRIRDMVSYDVFCTILYELGYFQNKNSEALINLLWESIALDTQEAHQLSLRIYLTAIEGIYYQWMSPQQEDEPIKGVSYLQDQQQALDISKKFFQLLLNRKRFLDQKRIEKQALKREELLKPKKYSHKKKSLKNSHLTDTEKSQIKGNHTEALIQKGIEYKQKKEQMRLQKELDELKDCSFIPQVNKSYLKYEQEHDHMVEQQQQQLRSFSQKTLRSKYQQEKSLDQSQTTVHSKLHNINPRIERSKDGRSPIDIEFERSKTECSFKPSLNQKSVLLVKQKKLIKQYGSSSIIKPLNQTTKIVNNEVSAKIIHSRKAFSPTNNRNTHSGLFSPKILHKTTSTAIKTELKPQQSKTSSILKRMKSNLSQTSSSQQLKSGMSQSTTLLSSIRKEITQSKTKKGSKNNSRTLKKTSVPQIEGKTNFIITNNIESKSQNDIQEHANETKTKSSQKPQPQYSYNSQQIPLLFMDVNLGKNNVQRLIINEGDSIEQIVDAFAREFNLSQRKKGKLMQAIEKQLAGHLPCIEEED